MTTSGYDKIYLKCEWEWSYYLGGERAREQEKSEMWGGIQSLSDFLF